MVVVGRRMMKAPLEKINSARRNSLTGPVRNITYNKQIISNGAGFTLMEILVSTLLIALTLLGLSNLFVAGKTHIQYSRTKMTGGELGKVFLDPLQMDVTQGERSLAAQNGWGQINNCLSSNPTTNCPTQQSMDNVTYTSAYIIDNVVVGNCVATNSCLRRVQLTVIWPEAQP